MSNYLCVSIRFLQPYCHARADQGQPEWPPSPLRLFQAMIAAASGHWNERVELRTAKAALQWLEQQPIEKIVAPVGTPSDSKHRLYVPDNVADKVAGSWSRGGSASIADHRTEKDLLPIHIDGEAVHYLWPLAGKKCPCLEILRSAARAIPHLGWGIDVVAGNAEILSEAEVANLLGEAWEPSTTTHGVPLRVTVDGTLTDVMRKHREFLNRLSADQRGNDSFRPVAPLLAFDLVHFRRMTDPIPRPHITFEFRNDDNTFFQYPQRKLIHIAGMVRHLAIETMKKSPPSGLPNVDEWIDRYVAGHARDYQGEHRQFSYLPLPSIGHRQADQAVRRVMIAAPLGDDHLLEHLARRLAGQQLKPTEKTKIDNPPTLIRNHRDTVAACYTREANAWASVTPVILPGHNDHKPAKTIKLIEKSLRQSGIEQLCTFEWRAVSWFSKSLTAHKYDRNKKLTGYIRPGHLLSQTAVHLKLQFNDGLKVPGPLVIGAGRHCGLGLMAVIN